jgi:hypothetical protein
MAALPGLSAELLAALALPALYLLTEPREAAWRKPAALPALAAE